MSDGEIETLKQAVQELERRKREDPLQHVYSPHGFQEPVHESRNDITLVVGGNRTGKTFVAVAEALLYCLGRAPYAETPDPPNTVWYVVPTGDTFEDAVKPIIEELVPQEEVRNVRGRKLKRYHFKNGSKLVIRSADQRQKRMVGAAVDFVVIDEPIPKTVYEELTARTIDTGGRMLMVLTPVSETQSDWLWIRDDLYIPSQTGERGDIDIINMPVITEDGEPAVPHLSKDQVEKMKRTYPDPQVRRARMYGDFVIRSGLVFGSFDPDIHLLDSFDIPQHWHEWMVCDPQYHRFAVLMFAADNEGNYYVTDEYFSADESLAKRAKRVKAMAGHRDRDLPMYVDYANQTDITELNWHFNRIDAPIGAVELPIQKKVDDMVLRVHSMLEPDPDRAYHRATGMQDTFGAPRLSMFKGLESTWKVKGKLHRTSRLIWELNRLTWDSKGRPDKESAGGGDMSDCLIYGCSIQASGVQEPSDDDWKKGLSERDRVIWESIERQDRKQEQGLQFPR